MRFPDLAKIYSLFLAHHRTTTDSRKILPDSIFFALKGETFDGNRFAASALQQGCSFAVIDDEKVYAELISVSDGSGKTILVKDVLQILQQLAQHHRSRFKIPVLALTGSNGKTTTKELIRNVLATKYKVLSTIGNLNNHIGVPLTVLAITPDIEIAVVEMGANHIGEIISLCEIAQPDYGLITNIGKAHIGEFGSFENIVKAKTELYRFIKKNKGKVFVNAENDLLMAQAETLEKITYAPSVRGGKYFSSVAFLEASPFLKVKHEDKVIATHLIGKYNFENISAAICVGEYFGVAGRQIKEAIEGYVSSDNRSQIIQTKTNTIILDAYNANPTSMRAAIENFSEMSARAEENKWLILGDMLELGKYEMEEHQNILQLLKERKIQNVILVGERFFNAISESSVSFPQLSLYKNSAQLCEKLKSDSPIKNLSLILLKGSRGMALEKAVKYL